MYFKTVCDVMLSTVDLDSLPYKDRRFLDENMRTVFGLAPNEGSREQIFRAMCCGYLKNMRDVNPLAYDVITSEVSRDAEFCEMLVLDIINCYRKTCL